VKVAYVLGFFENAIETELRAEFGEALTDRRIIVFGHRGANPPFDLRSFTSSFFERIKDGTTDPVIVIAQIRVKASPTGDKDWVERKLEEIVESGRARAIGREIRFVPERNAQNAESVVEILRAYGFSGRNDEVSREEVSQLLCGGTALCVRAMHQSKYETALERARVTCNFDEHFVEMVLSYNPNLVQALANDAKTHAALLYAFGGLKYLPPAFKRGFAGLLVQAETTAAVIARFKQAVQGRRR